MQITSEMQCHESLKFHYQIAEYAFLYSEYITFIKTHLVLSELQPIKVWLKYIGPKMVHRKSWIFLCHFVAFCSQIQNIQLFLKRHQY